MSELTLQEKISSGKHRGARVAAEKHFYDAAQPFYNLGFSVGYRNPGHWDIYADRPAYMEQAHNATTPDDPMYKQQVPSGGRMRERAFRIRGEPGKVWVGDERSTPHKELPKPPEYFRTVEAAMFWIMGELMQEPPRG